MWQPLTQECKSREIRRDFVSFRRCRIDLEEKVKGKNGAYYRPGAKSARILLTKPRPKMPKRKTRQTPVWHIKSELSIYLLYLKSENLFCRFTVWTKLFTLGLFALFGVLFVSFWVICDWRLADSLNSSLFTRIMLPCICFVISLIAIICISMIL